MTTGLTASASQYRAITREGEIRLLTIDPGQRKDPVTCSLSHTLLDDPKRPRYDALSYTWGSQDNSLLIFCNGQPLKAGVNLFAALRYLRRENEPRVVWID